MNKDAKMFAFLVGIGFSFAMILSFIPWDLFVTCIQNGMVPDLSNAEHNKKCVEVSTPKVFGQTYNSGLGIPSANITLQNMKE